MKTTKVTDHLPVDLKVSKAEQRFNVDILERDKPEAFALPVLVYLNDGGSHIPKRLKEFLELFLGDFRIQVLDVQVGKLSFHFVELGLTFLRIKFSLGNCKQARFFFTLREIWWPT